MVMAGEADSRPAVPSAAAAGDCLVWEMGEHSLSTIFPPKSLFLHWSGTAVGFKRTGGLKTFVLGPS